MVLDKNTAKKKPAELLLQFKMSKNEPENPF